MTVLCQVCDNEIDTGIECPLTFTFTCVDCAIAHGLSGKPRQPAATITPIGLLLRARSHDIAWLDLAQRLSVSGRTVFNWRKGITPIPFMAVWKLCLIVDFPLANVVPD